MLADIAEPGGAEQGVDDSMSQSVGVGVSVQAERVRNCDPTQDQLAVGHEPVRVIADADERHRTAAPIGSSRRARRSNTQSSLTPRRSKQLERTLVAGAHVLRAVSVAGERHRGAGVEAHAQERLGRVQLSDGLAQAGGRDLDGDTGLGDRFDGGLVVAPQVAGRQRSRASPDLHQVGMGEHVEQAAAGGVGERLEVTAPDRLGTAAAAPDAVFVHVERLVAEEVNRAEHVVEVVRLEQAGGAILASAHEVGLDAESQVGLLAHEPAVLPEVVAGVLDPEGMAPDLQRVAEAIDVL